MRNILLAFLAKFFNGLHFFSPVMLLYFSNIVGLTTSEFFYLQGLFSFFIFALEVPTGIIADKFSRKLSVVLGSVSAVLASYLMFRANSFMDALIAEFFIALGFALTSGAFDSLFYDSHQKANLMHNYKRNLGYLGNLSLFGILISALSGAFLADYFGLENIYFITGIACFCGLISALLMKDIREDKTSEVDRNKGILRSVVDVLHSNFRLRMLALDLAFVPAVAFMGIWLYQPYLQSFSASVYGFGALHASMVLMQVLINFLVPYFKKSLNFYIKNSQLWIGLFFLILGLSSNIWIGSVSLVLIVGVGMTRNTFLNQDINSHIESSFRSTFFSGVSMLNQFIRMFLTFVLGFLIDYSFSLVVFLLGIFMFVAYLLFHSLEEKL